MLFDEPSYAAFLLYLIKRTGGKALATATQMLVDFLRCRLIVVVPSVVVHSLTEVMCLTYVAVVTFFAKKGIN